ncbi:hypothetical protein P691DRAFT_763768 [Macrolepiota fuliginosa MF-IS2]|uniref:Uncharacterized protein n=1 Tax=Macrolepiota fuliginosa MF-IS2 TaxID=1400762 RepID=A0A9P5X4S3_9AGAR|nr:hypothetical protein P691DRAFT_763768 [Macrolepiota fuliginosa MF-IS2]
MRTIEPWSTSFTDEGLPPSWRSYSHPSGPSYFCLPPSKRRPFRVLTQDQLQYRETAKDIQEMIFSLLQKTTNCDASILSQSDLVLTSVRNYYCFMHHPTRSIYWAEPVDLENTMMFHELQGGTEQQVKRYLEVGYWHCWDAFSCVQTLSLEVSRYTVDTIVSAMTSVVFNNDTSNVTYPYETLQNMLNIIQAANDYKTSNWYIGRFMKRLVQDQFRISYGQLIVVTTREPKAIPVTPNKARSTILALLSPFLLFIPDAHLERLEPLIVDRYTVVTAWEPFLRDLSEELAQAMLLATIMLAANCAFLAIPTIDSQSPDTHSSPAQIASYLSLSFSLSGFILSMIMYRQFKFRGAETTSAVLGRAFCEDESGSRSRLEHLVLIWSLPHVFVLWSIIPFLVAFLIMCFSGTRVVTKIILAVFTVLQGSLILYCMVKFGGGRGLHELLHRQVEAHKEAAASDYPSSSPVNATTPLATGDGGR